MITEVEENVVLISTWKVSTEMETIEENQGFPDLALTCKELVSCCYHTYNEKRDFT